MQAVPTGLTMGPDGAFYVGELTGFPFVPGAARVWRVTADGEASVYAEGFTNVIDVAFDADGNLLVLEMVAGGLLNGNEEDPASLASRLVSVAPDGTQTTLIDSGLTFATGLAVGSDGAIYVSNFGVMPGMGQVLMIQPS
jgi:sugar lactone lactonase YvrE